MARIERIERIDADDLAKLWPRLARLAEVHAVAERFVLPVTAAAALMARLRVEKRGSLLDLGKRLDSAALWLGQHPRIDASRLIAASDRQSCAIVRSCSERNMCALRFDGGNVAHSATYVNRNVALFATFLLRKRINGLTATVLPCGSAMVCASARMERDQGEGLPMKKAIVAAAVVVGLGAAIISTAWAACPPGTAYHCTQGFNGKVICSCS
jgi:hypothetical protein